MEEVRRHVVFLIRNYEHLNQYSSSGNEEVSACFRAIKEKKNNQNFFFVSILPGFMKKSKVVANRDI